MSTYYGMHCKKCNEKVFTVALRNENQINWMVEEAEQSAADVFPKFMLQHLKHYGEIRVISEHDDEWLESE